MNGPSGERRMRPDRTASSITCRVCYLWVQVIPERVEETPMYVYYRCQKCECSFTIRRSDVDALRAAGAFER